MLISVCKAKIVPGNAADVGKPIVYGHIHIHDAGIGEATVD